MPVKTLVINNFSYTTNDGGLGPIYIETPTVHPGDVIRYKLDYCKFTNIVPTSKTLLVDGQQIPLTPERPGTQQGLLSGCHIIERAVTIPDTINPGRYYLNKELNYKTSAFHTEKVVYYTQYFQVVPIDLPSTSKPPDGGGQSLMAPNPGVSMEI